MVNPIDEVPDVSGAEATEYAENGTRSVATYTADGPGADGDHVVVAGMAPTPQPSRLRAAC